MKKPNVVGLLFGRKGSRGLPGKNVKNILGRPSLSYPLLAARHSGIVRDLFVSTDSEEIETIAAKFDAQPIGRPSHLASDTALLEEAIAYGFETATKKVPYAVDYFLIILCNSCTVVGERISKALEMLEADSRLDSVTTGAKYNMFSPIRARKMAEASTVEPYVPSEVLAQTVELSCDRDRATDCFFCDHSFTLVRASALAKIETNPMPFRWMGTKIGFIEQLPGGGDIDFAWQVPGVEWWLREHGFTETRTPYDAK